MTDDEVDVEPFLQHQTVNTRIHMKVLVRNKNKVWNVFSN